MQENLLFAINTLNLAYYLACLFLKSGIVWQNMMYFYTENVIKQVIEAPDGILQSI